MFFAYFIMLLHHIVTGFGTCLGSLDFKPIVAYGYNNLKYFRLFLNKKPLINVRESRYTNLNIPKQMSVLYTPILIFPCHLIGRTALVVQAEFQAHTT